MKRALHRQRGMFNLYWVFFFSALLAVAAMAALFSIRYDRNLFKEATSKAGQLLGNSGAALVDSARQAGKGNDGQMRRCVINGKSVISNTDCVAQNPSSKAIKIHDNSFEAPKKPAEPAIAPGSMPLTDKLIEKQLR